MTTNNFTFEIDDDGIALVVWDMDGRSMNVMTEDAMEEFIAITHRIAEDDAVKGAVLASGKDSFSGGADLSMLESLVAAGRRAEAEEGRAAASQVVMERGGILSRTLRAMETCGKPVVAALSGLCLGGAFEITLACHYRIAADNPKGKLGLPEGRVGLLPGGGGTQRLARLVGASDALQLMLQGRQIKFPQALKMGLLHKIVPADDLIAEAKRWLREEADPIAPWDKKGFRIPGGLPYSKNGMMTFTAANGIYRRETLDNYPALRAIMSCVYEGLLVDMDTGLRIESRYFTHILRSPEAQNMIRTLFLSMKQLGKGARRPANEPPVQIRKVGVLGAGMMGAGVAYVTAQAGIEVVLLDRDMEAAEKGKALSHDLMSKQIGRGRAKVKDRDELLARITPSADYDDLKGCDLIIEAVFENRDIKAEVTRQAEARLNEGAVFGSNTSTLPITGLAKASKRPENFIGIHFFSPVHKMMLVEIIMGEKTGDHALAAALDYVRAIRKTPIVVNDSRGFFTSRVVATYVSEGLTMLDEGMPPALVENLGRMAGMPVGPLSLNDEVGLDVAYKISAAAKADLGEAYRPGALDRILQEMVVGRERLGRKNHKGFYDYPKLGKKSLWPGLNEILPDPKPADAFDYDEVKRRFLTIQALETARCFEEKVLTDVRDADVGAILGFGYAPFTGGPLSYIDTMGAAAFVAQCETLAGRFGPRFAPCDLLREMAEGGEMFYTRFAP